MMVPVLTDNAHDYDFCITLCHFYKALRNQRSICQKNEDK